MVSNSTYKAAAVFMLIVGSMVMGIAAGMGVVAYMVKQRLVCVAVDGASGPCQDIVGPAMDMIFTSAAGGFVAFVAGLLAIALVIRDEQATEVDND